MIELPQVAQRLRDAFGDDADTDAITELATDWLREAGGGATHDATLQILFDDLRDDLARHSPDDLLTRYVVERRVRALSRRSLALGEQVLAGELSDDDARSAGEALLNEVEALSPQVKALTDDDPFVRALKKTFQQVSLEALYAIHREVMSARLQALDAEASDEAPPQVW
ncbi:MAG: hypothetical protein CMH57_07515 [Myxococcales bacterium]|nr:hypothetical protein [Myxococcales bacterium]